MSVLHHGTHRHHAAAGVAGEAGRGAASRLPAPLAVTPWPVSACVAARLRTAAAVRTAREQGAVLCWLVVVWWLQVLPQVLPIHVSAPRARMRVLLQSLAPVALPSLLHIAAAVTSTDFGSVVAPALEPYLQPSVPAAVVHTLVEAAPMFLRQVR